MGHGNYVCFEALTCCLIATLSPANYAQVLLQAVALWSLSSAESFFLLVRHEGWEKQIKSHFLHMLLLQKGFMEKSLHSSRPCMDLGAN